MKKKINKIFLFFCFINNQLMIKNGPNRFAIIRIMAFIDLEAALRLLLFSSGFRRGYLYTSGGAIRGKNNAGPRSSPGTLADA